MFSQDQFKITGTVLDEDGNKIEIGDVLLRSTNDPSEILEYTYIDNGAFKFKDVNEGIYEMHISSLGFQKFTEIVDLKSDKYFYITLQQTTTTLDEVVLESKKEMFKVQGGKIIANIQNTLLSAEPTGTALLAKLPGVQVSPDQESISYIGKGNILIYMGSQRLSLDEFNNVPVDNIKTIEIVKNPSAKYEADGRVVVLVTPTKKNIEGYTLSLSETLDFRRKFSNYLGVNLYTKSEKLEIRTNLDYNQLQPWESNAFDYNLNDIGLESGYRVIVDTKRPELKGGLGLHYQINDEDYISFNSNIRSRNDQNSFVANSFLSLPSESRQNLRTENESDVEQILFSNNINYNNSLERIDGNLFLGIQYSAFKKESGQNIQDIINNEVINSNIDQSYSADVFSARVDFEKPLNKGWQLELGSKASVAKSTTGFDTDTFQDALETDNTSYDFNEKNYAFYSQLTGRIKKVDVIFGLRSETTNIRGGFENNYQNVIDSTYTNWFPKAGLSFPLDSTKTIHLNYAKSINRPNYSSLNQALVYINPFVVFQGNFNLKPAIAHEFSASINFKHFTLEAGYTETNNPAYYIPSYDPDGNLFTIGLQNIDKERTSMIAVSFPYSYKKWSTYNYAAGYHIKLTDPAGILGETSPLLYFYSNNEFVLSKGYSILLSGWLITHSKEGIYERGTASSLDLGVSKTLFGKIKCSLTIADIFNTTRRTERFTFNNIQSEGVWYTNSRRFALNFKYSIGEIKKSSFRNRDVDENSRF